MWPVTSDLISVCVIPAGDFSSASKRTAIHFSAASTLPADSAERTSSNRATTNWDILYLSARAYASQWTS